MEHHSTPHQHTYTSLQVIIILVSCYSLQTPRSELFPNSATNSQLQKKHAGYAGHITCSVFIQHCGLQAFQSHSSSFKKVSFLLLIFLVSTWQKQHSLPALLQVPRAQTWGFAFFTVWNTLYYQFSSPNIYTLIFSVKSESQTLCKLKR